MPERVRTAVRAAVISTAAAALAFTALKEVLSPNLGVLLVFLPSVWTGKTTAQTYKFVRENVLSTALGTVIGLLYRLAVPPDVLDGWLHAGLLIIPLALLAFAHGFSVVRDYCVVHLAVLSLLVAQMPGPLYEFPLIVALACAFAMGAALCPRPLGALNARDVFCEQIVCCLHAFDEYFNCLYNEKLFRTKTLADYESKCYRSHFSSEWSSVLVLLESALLRLTGMHESIGGDNWKGYSKAFVAALWQPSLPSFERLKSETMLLVANTSTSVRQAAARTSIEDSAAELNKATAISSERRVGNDIEAQTTQDPGRVDTESAQVEVMQRLRSMSYDGSGTADRSRQVAPSSLSEPADVDSTHMGSPQTFVGNGARAENSGSQIRARSTTAVSFKGICINPTNDLGVAYTYAKIVSVETEDRDEVICAELIESMTQNARKRLSSGEGWDDSKEELGRFGTFSSSSIDYYAHLQAIERKVKKLGLKWSFQSVRYALRARFAQSLSGTQQVLRHPWRNGVLPAFQEYDIKPWRYWLRLCILVWLEWVAINCYTMMYGYDQRLVWVTFTTVIVVKPVMVVSVNIGLQRVAGTLVTFAIGWGTVILVQSNLFAYLYANLLVVLVAKFGEMWLGPSGYFAMVAQLTWQVMVFGTIDNPQVDFMYSFSRFLTILIGTLVGVFGSLVIFPEFVTPKLFNSIKRLCSLFLETFMTVVSAEALHGDVDNDILNSLRVKTAAELSGMHELIRLAYMESKYAIHWSKAMRTMPWKTLSCNTWYMRRALAGMVSTSRSGVFSDPTVHAAVIDPIQHDVDAVVGDMVSSFTRIADQLEARLHNRRAQLQKPHFEDRSSDGIDALMTDSWHHYSKLRQLVVEGKLSVWYTMSFARLFFSIRDFCTVANEIEAALLDSTKTD